MQRVLAMYCNMCNNKYMNRAQRRAQKSKKKARFGGLNKKQVLLPDSWR